MLMNTTKQSHSKILGMTGGKVIHFESKIANIPQNHEIVCLSKCSLLAVTLTKYLNIQFQIVVTLTE